MKLALLLIALCAACAPTDPQLAAPFYSAQVTAIQHAADVQATAAPATQNAANENFARSLTETFVPPALTATSAANESTRLANVQISERSTIQALYNQGAISATQSAQQILESEVQRAIADNNRAMADSIRWGNFWQSVLEWGALIVLFSLSTSAAWGVIQFGLFAHTYRTERETELRRQLRMRIYRESLREANKDGEQEFLLTTAGPMVKTHSVITIADKHIENYQRASNWRAVCKTYIQSCIHLERGGVRQPYSRPNCLTYELIQDPATGGAWQLGHERVVGLLRAVGVIDNTGKGGATRLIVDVSEYARVIDLAPLPKLPPDPIPNAKIIVAGWQAAQVPAG